MSITDELRKWVKSLYTPNSATVKDEGERIADRIDAEHQKCIDAMWEDAKPHLGDESLTEQGWIRLPKDADDVPWRIGDRDEDGNVVTQLRVSSDGWYAVTDGPSAFHPDQRRHYHAPTVEDVLTEFGIDWEHESDCEDRAALLKEYASKLRLAKEDA